MFVEVHLFEAGLVASADAIKDEAAAVGTLLLVQPRAWKPHLFTLLPFILDVAVIVQCAAICQGV